MTSRNRSKGKALERYVASYLTERGFKVWRPRDGYPHDVGDVLFEEIPLTLQCKWINNLTTGVREALDGAAVQSLNASEHMPGEKIWVGGGVVHRHRRPMEDAVVVFTLTEFTELLLELSKEN